MRKSVLAAVAAMGAMAVIGGCGTPGGSPTAAAPAVSSTSDSPAAAPAASSTSDSPTPGQKGAAQATAGGAQKTRGAVTTSQRCHTGGLNARLSAGEPYEHNDQYFTDVRVRFTNTSGSTCTMYGFPGADLVGGSGAKRRFSLPRAGQGERITLKAGDSAHAVIRIWDVPNAEVPTLPSQVELTPPDETTHITLDWPKSLPVAYTSTTQPGIGLPNAIEPVAAGA